MKTTNTNFTVALSFIGIFFFSIGFALGINAFLMPVLKTAMHMSGAASSLLLGATFVPFSIVGVSGVAVWGRLRMAIGPRDMVVARGFTCDEVKDGAAFVTAADSTLQTACMPLGGRFASADWLSRGFLEVGPLIVGTADVEMLADNVTATVF